MEAKATEPGTADRLAELLLGRARAKLFAVLFAQPEREFYFRELARLSGLSTSSLRRELLPLLRAGVLRQRDQANLVYYQANSSHPCFPELKSLIDKTAGIAAQLQASLLPIGDRIEHAFVYGSFANGTPTASSDIDLMVVGGVSFGDVAETVRPVAERLGRSVSPAVYGVKEFHRQLADGQSFLLSVLQRPRIDLIGASDELAQARQPRAARALAHRAPAQGRNRSAARRRGRESRR